MGAILSVSLMSARIRRAASRLFSVLGSWTSLAVGMTLLVWFIAGPLIVLWAGHRHRHYSEFGRWVDRLLVEHPTILIVSLVGTFLPSVIGALMDRNYRKNYPALEANRKKKQAEAIKPCKTSPIGLMARPGQK